MSEITEQNAPPRFEACIFFDNCLMEKRSGDDPEKLEVWMLSRAGESGNYNGKIVDLQDGGKLVKAFRYSAPDS